MNKIQSLRNATDLKPCQLNKNRIRITCLSMLTFMGALVLVSCQTAPRELEETDIQNPKSSVDVSHISHGAIDDELMLSATTVYLKRNVVTSTIPAFITHVKVKLGDAVQQGDVLYELESKERRSLGSITTDTSLASFGLVKVRASATGVISTLDKQQPGDYVLEGTLLCTIAQSTDLAFQVNVPYEYVPFTKQGQVCQIVLPDNSSHLAKFTTPLTAMNVLAQTQTILAKTTMPLVLPENMMVKVLVNKSTDQKKQVLPKQGVLSDEMMKTFWIMKLINDSTAVKIPVVVGNRNADMIEIQSPLFSDEDRIIVKGNYGLADTALVKVNH